MLTAENEKLIQDYLDIAVNASENLERTMDSLSEDCNWYITLPGIAFTEKKRSGRLPGWQWVCARTTPTRKLKFVLAALASVCG
jgi:hypothetical protein